MAEATITPEQTAETKGKTIETEEKAEVTETGSGGIGALISPEGLIMLFTALFLDVIGFILVTFLLDDLGVTDIIGSLVIGGWILFRSGSFSGKSKPSGAGKTAKMAQKMKWIRPLCIISEWIPYVGALPSWTILVYFELTNS